MTEETFLDLLDEAKREFMGKKKQPSTPAKQFEKGAKWLWDLLMERHDQTYYEEQVRRELIDRIGEVEPWKESLITEFAEKKVRLDSMIADIQKEGYLLEKYDKNMNAYKESNPLLVHTKELERTIGMWREHLGLSNKVNPKRITESSRKGVDVEKDGLTSRLSDVQDIMNEVPEM